MSCRVVSTLCIVLMTLGIAGCDRNAPPAPAAPAPTAGALPEQFLSLMNAGKNRQDQGDATNALAIYRQAVAIVPNDPDVRLNLANCHLLAAEPEPAIREAQELLKLEPNSAAAYFVLGSAYLRLSRMEEAAKAFENVKRIDPGETSTFFQLGSARMGLGQWDEAIKAFQEGIALDPNRLHAAAHYRLSQALLRVGRNAEAQEELQLHQGGAEAGAGASGPGIFERCKYTQARVPFRLEQPEAAGIAVRWVDATREVLGDAADRLAGPVAVLDVDRSGWNSLFALETGKGLQLLRNTNGILRAAGQALPFPDAANYTKALVGDLQNDRADEIVVLGKPGCRVIHVQTNGVVSDVTATNRLANLALQDGLLIDLDFTGKLDLVGVSGADQGLQLFRQFGPLAFNDITRTSGIPATLRNATGVVMEDWNRDGITDLIISRKTGAPLLLEKQRGGRLVPREIPAWVSGGVIVAGDFDNDLRPDLAIVGQGRITVCSSGGARQEIAFAGTAGIRQLVAVDYDNDGWLDLWATGDSMRVWRNRGLLGFEDQTRQLGLDDLKAGAVSEIHFADFDRDCDSDAIVVLAAGGIRYLRNDGGNAQSQIKVHLVGNRSNASGIGSRIEVEAGGLRLIRTVTQLPVEVGMGRHAKLDSFLVHWFNWPQGSAEVPFECREPLLALELTIQEGSCPYLYAWNGERFEFVTDILGAAPLGLPVAEGRHIEADPEEWVWVGNEKSFRPRDGRLEVRITEELREVLYLDQARLAVVDHEPGTEVHSSDKLLPGKPFPKGSLVTLREEHPLVRGETLQGRDVTAELRQVDGRRVSPPALRGPQLRGLAEPHGLILDFGELDATRPLVMVLNGWLRFGGGMANIAASHDPALPFPFPILEAEVAPGSWRAVDVAVGAPAGKTKTILVDLEGRLPAGSHRLRLSQAFEIHWDRIALLEKSRAHATRIHTMDPATADLRFRGFSPMKDLPADWPLSPDYARVSPNSHWTITPGGWCTRYGDVRELVAARDEGLVVMNGGDELRLEFDPAALPPKPAGWVREYFLYVDGWDKDSDFHVTTGAHVDPLPFHGMDDQAYGSEARPVFPSDALHRKYNTRWVEGRVLRQNSASGIRPGRQPPRSQPL